MLFFARAGMLAICLCGCVSAAVAGTHPLPGIILDPDGNGFRTEAGRPYVPFGVTYYRPGTGWAPQLWKQFDAAATERDFALMKKAGVNCVRVFLSYGSFLPEAGKPSEEGLKKFDKFLELAERAGMYVHPTGPDNWEGRPAWAGDEFADETTLRALENYWKEFCLRYRGRKVIFALDLLNEPAVAWDNPTMRPKWRAWVHGRYPDSAAMARAWGDAAAKFDYDAPPAPPPRNARYLDTATHSLAPPERGEGRGEGNRARNSSASSPQPSDGTTQVLPAGRAPPSREEREKMVAVTTSAPHNAPGSKWLLDYQHFREDVAQEWVRRQVTAIKSVDPTRLVTTGMIQWSIPSLLPAVSHYSGFRPTQMAPLLDFLEVHFYPLAHGFYAYESPVEEARNLAYLEGVVREVASAGKPVVLEEFGWYGGGHLTIDQGHHPAATEQQQAGWDKHAVEVSQGFATGWLNWGFFDQPEATDVSQLTGLYTSQGKEKAWGKEFKRLSHAYAGQRIARRTVNRPSLDWDACLTDTGAGDSFREAYYRSYAGGSPPK